MFKTNQIIIAQLSLTGDFIQKNVFFSSAPISNTDVKQRWNHFIGRTGLIDIPILQKKAFLDEQHLPLSAYLLSLGFDIIFASNEFAALSLELIRDDARLNTAHRDPNSFMDSCRKEPVLAFSDPNYNRELLAAGEILAPRNQLIVFSNRSAPVEFQPFMEQWVNLSSNEQVHLNDSQDLSGELDNSFDWAPDFVSIDDDKTSTFADFSNGSKTPVTESMQNKSSAASVSRVSDKAECTQEVKQDQSNKSDKPSVLPPGKAEDTVNIVREPASKAQPDVPFWKEKIQKLLDNYVEGKGGRIPVERTLYWLYSLQLNCDISILTPQDVLISPSVYALLRDNLPTRVRWMEEDGAPAELLHINQPEIQPIPAQQAAEQLQLGAKFSPESEDGAANWTAPTQTIPDIGHVVESADLLSHYCRWLKQKKQLEKRGAASQTEISRTEESFDLQAQKLSLYNWIKWNSFPKDDLYEELALCYDSLIASFRLLKLIQDGSLESNELKTVYKKSAQIAADVQCGLKSWLRDQCFDISVDHVLNEAYRYLVELAREEQFFLYHLKAVDALPLSMLSNLNEEINSLKDQFFSRNIETKQQKKLKGKLEYDIKKLSENRNSIEQWNRVIQVASELMDDFGMPPSDLFFRQLFDPILSKLPEEADTTESFGRIVQEIDIYNNRIKEAEEAPLDLEIDVELPTNVQKVRQKFGGTHVVFIGGEPKEHIMKRIEERLNLKVDWNSTNHGDSLSRFDKWLNDPDVSLFLIYIPWCSHKHSEDLAGMVDRAGKTLVRLRKGTNPDMIAEAIYLQAIGRR